ncbi:hypothetical protein RclHR1_00090039 [Rhizophagus clarus]|uniref:G-protein coupled receptors family 1 profile domain-containing protein n=1 Tax=Rhizophagus clarus TaxID=94130 RepID=A0A2Z6SDF4_9GLOM|nr:hypothetical protein RclHR1_00090039 [Rhizophagus clarus]
MITPAAFLFIFLASNCNAIDIKHTDLEFEDDTYTNYQEIPKLDDTRVYGPDAVRNFYIVLIIGIIALQFNLFGSLYVIYRTYLQLKRGGRNNVPLSLRFPFYIALTDTFLSLTFSVNLIPLLTYFFFTLAGIENVLLDVLATTTINFGGIGNFIQFAINEGFSNSSKLNSSSSIDQNVQPETSIVVTSTTTHEIGGHANDNDVNQSNINDHPEEETSDSNDIIIYNNREYEKSIEDMRDININIIDENDMLKNDDDMLTVYDSINLVSANSSNGLLNDDSDFQQELNEYK